MRLLFVCIVFCSGIAQAQEAFGTVMSNYLPTHKVLMNPASMSDSKVWLDIQILGGGSYVNNNMMYIKNRNALDFLDSASRSVYVDDVGFNRRPNKYNAYARGYAQVLSAVWTQGDHGIGFSLGIRSFTAFRKLPDFIPDFVEDNGANQSLYVNKQFNLKNIRISSNNYAQVQVSYSNIFLKDHRNMLTGGISLKKFVPLAGAATTIYDADLIVLPDSLVRINHLQADGMIAQNPHISLRGGWGIDLGISYQKMLRECSSYYPNSTKMGCVYMPYKYKIAASIVDFGFVKHNPRNADFAGYEFEGYTYSYRGVELNQGTVIETFEDFESNVNEGKVKNNYKIATPAMLSVQGDYNLYASRVYIYGTINQGLAIGKRTFGTRRANSLMAAVRYESRYFEAAIPFSLYEYTRPQLGLSFRLYCLTLGTDKLLSLFGSRDLYGADIYFSLNIPIFYHPACAENMRRGGGFYSGKRGFGSKKRRSISNCDAF